MTNKILLTFSCNVEIARHFINKMQGLPGEKSALLLSKQLPVLQSLLAEAGIINVYCLPESFYGQITQTETRIVLERVKQCGFSSAYYPLGDFGGNIVLLLAPLVRNITTINVTSTHPVQQDISCGEIKVTASVRMPHALSIQRDIVARLMQYQDRISVLWSDDRSGEKPTTGLIDDYPYDSEVLSHYVYAATHSRGQVREVGCGMGYGAYLMSRINPELNIEAIDQDAEVIALAQEMWGESPGLRFRLADAHTLPWESGSADTIVSFEVIEHVQKPDVYLTEIYRVLKGGGCIIGSTPNSERFPYRVNLAQQTSYHQLRKEGVWPWHIQYFDEESLADLLSELDFKNIAISYPTFVDGITLYNESLVNPEAGEFTGLSKLQWNVDSFAMTEGYIPGFSGYSFIFSATRGNG